MVEHQGELKQALAKGLAYLAAQQRSDGGFDSFSSPSTTQFEKRFTYQTTFVPALILAALSSLDSPASHRLRQRLATFIKAQRGPSWSFNYWAVASPQRTRQPYPDDLDDTCCALIGLVLHDPDSVGPAALAAFVKLLLNAEAQPGGPYRTWLVSADAPAAWRDVDLAVNANVGYLLSLVSEPLPNLTALMEQAITEERLTSPYYASAYPLIYYLSRAYRGVLRQRLRNLAQALWVKDDSLSPLKQALLLTSLLRLGATDLSPLISQLLAAQQPDGAWPADAFCLDPARASIRYYHGSESLTTALVLEALETYRLKLSNKTLAASQATNDQSLTPTKIVPRTAQPAFQRRVLAQVRRDCQRLQPELRSKLLHFVERVAHSSSGAEIVNLPLYFNQSLVRPLGKSFQPLLVSLGAANLYGWAAYTLFDDLLDGDSGPAVLPVATSCLRYCLSTFREVLPDDQAFQSLVQQTFDSIDSANAWELAHCRWRRQGQHIIVMAMPKYEQVVKLADRSLGHSLTPLAVLRAAGFETDSAPFRSVQQAMVHYLAGRQLNDDAHDWQTDLQHSQISYVVAHILADAQVKPGRYAWNLLLERAQQQFWYQSLPMICQDMKRQTRLSRAKLRGLAELQPQNIITELLDSIEVSANDALAAQKQGVAFLQHYKRQGQAVPS